MWGKISPKFIEICMETPCVPIQMGTNEASKSQQIDTSVTEFCYKTMNLLSRNSKTLK